MLPLNVASGDAPLEGSGASEAAPLADGFASAAGGGGGGGGGGPAGRGMRKGGRGGAGRPEEDVPEPADRGGSGDDRDQGQPAGGVHSCSEATSPESPVRSGPPGSWPVATGSPE